MQQPIQLLTIFRRLQYGLSLLDSDKIGAIKANHVNDLFLPWIPGRTTRRLIEAGLTTRYYFGMATSPLTSTRHGFQTDDPRLQPIAAKVFARERLTFDDAVALYRSPDILAIGWLANHVRERLPGNGAYFNVNRHINPTNVCVAAC